MLISFALSSVFLNHINHGIKKETVLNKKSVHKTDFLL